MGLRESVLEWFGGVPASEVDERVSRAYEVGFYDGNDDPASGDIAKGGFGYSRISDGYLRESDIDFKQALNTAWKLWQKSPIAKRVISMKRDHIIGHNAMPSTDSENEDLSERIIAFWSDNKLEHRASEFTAQLFGFGEQCFPAFVRRADGRVRLGYIDPKNIHKIEKDPDNSLEDWAVVINRVVDHVTEKRVYRIIRPDEDFADEQQAMAAQYAGKMVTAEQATLRPWEETMLAGYGRPEYDGSCFYAKVNAVSNQTRGMSDLLQIGDWLDQADEVLFALADREQFAGYFSWDVTIEGADDEAIRKRSEKIRQNPPAKGSVNVHNERETWDQWAPNLGQTGTIETFRAILGLILGGMGFPVHWYGFGDDANRATAVAQSEPTTKSLEHDQGIVKALFLDMCQFAVDQAIIAGVLAEEDAADYKLMLDLPEVSTKDIGRVTASLGALAQALVVARQEGWMSTESAARAWAKMMAELDIDIDPSVELDAVAEEQAEREQQRAQMQNNALTQMMGQNGQQQPTGNGQQPDTVGAEDKTA